MMKGEKIEDFKKIKRVKFDLNEEKKVRVWQKYDDGKIVNTKMDILPNKVVVEESRFPEKVSLCEMKSLPNLCNELKVELDIDFSPKGRLLDNKFVKICSNNCGVWVNGMVSSKIRVFETFSGAECVDLGSDYIVKSNYDEIDPNNVIREKILEGYIVERRDHKELIMNFRDDLNKRLVEDQGKKVYLKID